MKSHYIRFYLKRTYVANDYISSEFGGLKKMKAMKWFYSYFKKYQWRMIIGLVMVTITSVLAIVNPKITGFIVDDIIGDGSNIRLDLLPKFLLDRKSTRLNSSH